MTTTCLVWKNFALYHKITRYSVSVFSVLDLLIHKQLIILFLKGCTVVQFQINQRILDHMCLIVDIYYCFYLDGYGFHIKMFVWGNFS